MKALVVPVSVLMCIVACPRGLSAQITLTQTFCLDAQHQCVWTYHNDNSRGGVNPNETRFKPHFAFTGLTATPVATDGLIYAQPLFIQGLHGAGNNPVGTCTGNVDTAFVATENNSLYAVNAANGTVCWHNQLDRTSPAETAIPYTSLPNNSQVPPTPCYNLIPQVGITGTPVIDRTVTPPVLYVVTNHQTNSGNGNVTFDQLLHAIDTTTGNEVAPALSLPTSLGGFVSILQGQRSALALFNPSSNLASIYVAWASYCDYNTSLGNYDGWVAGFQLNYNSLSSGFRLLGSFISEPPTNGPHFGGVWMAGSAPAIDGNGNVYVAVANGDWAQYNPPNFGWGNSVMKLSSALAYEDFYTPNDWFQLDHGSGQEGVCFVPTNPYYNQCPSGDTKTLAEDTDMGTGGVVLLNNSSPTELASVGKQGIVYVVPYDTSTSSSTTMGGLDGCGYNCSSGSGSNPQNTACSVTTSLPYPGNIAQCFDAMPIGNFKQNLDLNGIRGAPAFWSPGATSPNQYLYAVGLHDRMYWFNYANTFDTANPPQSDHPFDAQNPGGLAVGGTTSITWNGTDATTGVTWALDSNGYGRQYTNITPPFECSSQAVLYAYPAIPGTPQCDDDTSVCELWDSNELQNASTVMPGAVKFTVPTIVDGYILIGGGTPNYFATRSSTEQRCQVVSACDPANFPSCAGQFDHSALTR